VATEKTLEKEMENREKKERMRGYNSEGDYISLLVILFVETLCVSVAMFN